MAKDVILRADIGGAASASAGSVDLEKTMVIPRGDTPKPAYTAAAAPAAEKADTAILLLSDWIWSL